MLCAFSLYVFYEDEEKEKENF